MELLFIGPKGAEDGSDIALNAAAREHGVDAFLRVEPFLPRHDSLERLAQAHVMVSFYQDSKMAVPSKVFEYLTLPGRVLAFATRSCATAQVLENTGAEVVDPGDHAAHREALERLYDAFLDRRLEPISPPMMLRREAQASLLVDALEQRLGLSARAEEDAAASPLPEVVR
jgi:hypothetical protein